jgi:aspartate kinase
MKEAWGRPPTDAEVDRVLGCGEILSSTLVAGALEAHGMPAAWFDARRVVMTDDRFTRANPRMEEIGPLAARDLAPLLDQGRIPVTQGFIGQAPDGRPSTLGRGGGDFTASLLGAALGADRVEIWTDVDGIMTADPRIVPAARLLERATYEEVAELATFGARVLHPATQTPLSERGIPIVVLNARRPEGRGTTITDAGFLDRPGSSPVRSISWRPRIRIVNVRAPRMFGAYGFLRRLFEVFERFEIPVDVLASGEVSVSLTVDEEDWHDGVVAALSDLGTVTVEPGRAIVSVVGVGLRTTPGIAARIFDAIQPANVEMISQGASAINVTFVVEEAEGRGAVQRLHAAFFEEGAGVNET